MAVHRGVAGVVRFGNAPVAGVAVVSDARGFSRRLVTGRPPVSLAGALTGSVLDQRTEEPSCHERTLPEADADAARAVRVRVGIDAAVVAQHQVCVRETEADGRVRADRFHVPPTLAGLRSLTGRLARHPGVMAVAEPTSMTWLGLSVALRRRRL